MDKFLIRDAKTHKRLGTNDDASSTVTHPDGTQIDYERDALYVDAYCDEDRAELDEWVARNS